MIKLCLIQIPLLFCLTCQAQLHKAVMTAAQLQQVERGYGMFIHFGLNTFNETEWSDGTLPANSYQPTNLDCDQWVKFAKEAGFRYVILVTKHHDGFCLWNSKYTDYDVAATSVPTDVVGEVAKACNKYGLKLGLYYSLWDRHEPSYKNTPAYLDYMKKQLTELLTQYGEISELWFDGGWNKKDAEWDLPSVYQHVKSLQKNILLTVNHSIGKPENHSAIRQPKDYTKGDPIRYYPIDFRIKDPNFARWDDPKYYDWKGQLHYLSFEHTICLSDRWNWFQKKQVLAARPVDELEELFYWGTANDNILIVNVPPDETGNIRTHEQIRMLELANRLGIRGGKSKLPSGPVNQAFNLPIYASSATANDPAKNAIDYSLETAWTATDTLANLEIAFTKSTSFNRVSIMENAKMKDLGDGFSSIRIFNIQEFELQSYANGAWNSFYTGETIGACKIIQLPIYIKCDKIRLVIRKASGPPSICHIAIADNASKGIRTVKNNW